MSGRGRGGDGGRGRGRGVGRQSSSSSGYNVRGGGGQGGGGCGRGVGRESSSSSGYNVRGGGGHGGSGRGHGVGLGYNVPSPAERHAASASLSSSAASASVISREIEQKLEFEASALALGSEVSVQKAGGKAVEQHKLSLASSKMSRPPARPGNGTAGLRCKVVVNHFLVKVEFDPDKEPHHYDVSITPEVWSKKVCRDIIRQLVASYGQSGSEMLWILAYDGRKTGYARGKLPFGSSDFLVKLPDENDISREREFMVSIKSVTELGIYRHQQFQQGGHLDVPQDIIQPLDVILRQKPSASYEVVGRSFFHPSLGGRGKLGDGIEYWKGFYQSLRPTQMGLSLNFDVSARAFYEPIKVTEFVSKYLNKRILTGPLCDQDRIKVKKALRGLKVQHEYMGPEKVRRYKISGVTALPIDQLTFRCNETYVTVVQYFKDKYGIELTHTALPALQSGNVAKPKYLPMELCTIVQGQRYTKMLNDKQVTALLEATRERPAARKKSIETMVMHNYNGGLHQEFGIQVSTKLTSIEARVLPPPMIKYHETGGQSLVKPSGGRWNMIKKKMVNGGKVDVWTCISFSRDFHLVDVRNFCKKLVDMCRRKGMEFCSDAVVDIEFADPNDIKRALLNILDKIRNSEHKGKELQLLIIILPDVDAKGSYGTIKRVCETDLGIVSQCCQPNGASKANTLYLQNVALKINVKVGGRNAILQQAAQRQLPGLKSCPTIIFGADVTHPRPGEDSSPSIAAVVASMDWPEVTTYRALVSAQPSRKEIIQDLYTVYEDSEKGTVHGGMIRELLLAFKHSTGQKPSKIIFYRGGVSERQFNQVLCEEMTAIQKACDSVTVQSKVTFIVVQKRHHTRLFPTDTSGNISPGTVVDTKICHPTGFDFYLCSHANEGIQGTSRPAHYHVLYDENKFTADDLQTLTNNLCYTYARCTRSVSIVPPAYYAHLAAFRARYYIEGEYSDSGSASGGTLSREQNVEVRQLPAIKNNVKHLMFYC